MKMKLIIQIPCLNEEKTLPLVLNGLPKKIKGIKKIEVVVIDDGSTDNTGEIAKKYGVTVIKHKKNLGLGIAFKHGLEYALKSKADILVNTDADNQYPSKYISSLVKPIADNKADMVIGNRKPWKVKHFSFMKRKLQKFGSKMVRRLTNTNVPDTVSGFRAYSKEAMLKLNITTRFSYVLDTIMQASQKDLKIMSIPIDVNLPTRKSRLFKNMFQHIRKSGFNLLRIYVIYKPFRMFSWLSLIFFIPGFLLGLRFLYFYVNNSGGGRIQSLIATAILILTAVVMFALGIIGEILRTNRELVEYSIYLNKKKYFE